MSHSVIQSRVCLSWLAVQLLVAVACGGGSSSSSTASPTSPSGSSNTTTITTAASACRTYATADQRAETSSAGLVGAITDNCQFSKANNQLTCTTNYSDNRGSAYTSNSTTKFASVGDYVGDAPRVFIYSTTTTHPASISTNTAGTATNGTYTYDTQGRLTVFNTQLSTGASEVITFTAWDTSGRPTAGSDSNGTAFTYTYNDSTRTVTTSNKTGTITQTLDSNGILLVQVSVVSGGETVTITQTTQATDTVCK